MFAYEPPIDPPCDYWEEYGKPDFIKQKINEICKSILEKGDKTPFQEIFDYIYENVEEKLFEYSPRCSYGNGD